MVRLRLRVGRAWRWIREGSVCRAVEAFCVAHGEGSRGLREIWAKRSIPCTVRYRSRGVVVSKDDPLALLHSRSIRSITPSPKRGKVVIVPYTYRPECLDVLCAYM